jgi:hypothetical protein
MLLNFLPYSTNPKFLFPLNQYIIQMEFIAVGMLNQFWGFTIQAQSGEVIIQ